MTVPQGNVIVGFAFTVVECNLFSALVQRATTVSLVGVEWLQQVICEFLEIWIGFFPPGVVLFKKKIIFDLQEYII